MTKNSSPKATTQTVVTAGQKAALVRADCTNWLACFPSGDNITSAEAVNPAAKPQRSNGQDTQQPVALIISIDA